MVHKYSTAALELRRQRARDRGFIRHIWPKSNGCNDDELVAVATAASDAYEPDAIDPLSVFDPWAAHSCGGHITSTYRKVNKDRTDFQALWKSYLPLAGPPASSSLSASACAFAPATDSSSIHVELQNAMDLIACQNSTIAVLTAELEDLRKRWLPPITIQESSLTSHPDNSQAGFSNPSQSMAGSQQFLELSDCDKSLQTQELIHSQIMSALSGPISEMISSRSLNIVASIQEHIKDCILDHDKVIAKQVQSLAKRLDDLDLPCSQDHSSPRLVADDQCDDGVDALPRSQDDDDESVPAAAATLFEEQPRVVTESNIESGMLVNIEGLTKAVYLNGSIGHVIEFDKTTHRYCIQLASQKQPVKVRKENLKYPAVCSYCGSEVTSMTCYACTSKADCEQLECDLAASKDRSSLSQHHVGASASVGPLHS